MMSDHSISEETNLRLLRHDLYNPINQIVGYSELLTEELDAGEDIATEDLSKIKDSALVLLEMIRSRLTPQELQAEKHSSTNESSGSVVQLKTNHSNKQHLRSSDRLSGRKGRILVVDDNASNRDLLVASLSRQGHVVSTAEDGEIAVNIVKEKPFDLILLDVQMPRLNGEEVLEYLKDNHQYSVIPVIMISGLDDIDVVIRCINSGADDYLPKPCNLTLLRARVDSSLEKKFRYDDDLTLYENLKEAQSRVRAQIDQAQSVISELSGSSSHDPNVTRLLSHVSEIASVLVENDTALHVTIQKLEVKISRQSVVSQVKAITSDPAFQSLSERARLMRQRRQQLGA
ncbi:MAG TPA: hypothetical protein DCR17_11290 [Verrucomicrobiales bacterium]|nr:MAG: hypothetical protein CBC50_09080 [Synechococcus sp. TMED90]HAO67256.1 hypothetical protein [Verrucomicrobiales bacterium]